jgi:hypothetical protein
MAGNGRYLVRLAQELRVWGQRLLGALPRRWNPRDETATTIYCQPWDHVRIGTAVSIVRLPDPASCPGATIVLTPESVWGTTSIVSMGGRHVEGVASVVIPESWAWVEAVSYGAPVVTGAATLGGWRLRWGSDLVTLVAAGVLTNPRLADGVRVAELGGTCTTTDTSTWVTLLELPVRLLPNATFDLDIFRSTPSGAYKILGYWDDAPSLGTSILLPGLTTWSATSSEVRVRDPGSGSNLLVEVNGALAETETWEGYARIVGGTI